MPIGDRIAARRKQLGLTQEELAKRMGYKSKAAISKIETNVNDITQSTVVKFAEVLDTSINYLMGWEYSAPPAGFQSMPPMDAATPLVGDIACGSPILAEENIRDYIAAPSNWRADFALECHGDSMSPKILDGDVVAIRKVSQIDNGQIAAVRIDDEATLKRLYRYPDKLVLQAENPAYEPIVLIGADMEHATVEGLAVGIMRNI